jgi:hypothetical protein
MIGKLFEKILLSRILYEVSGSGLLRDEQFGFRPKPALRYSSPAFWKAFPGILTRRV